MKFINDTPFAAALYRTTLRDETRYFNSMLARVRHVLDDGILRPMSDTEQPESLRTEPVELPYAVLPEEQFYPRTGTDLVVLGDAIAPQGETVEVMDVQLDAGPYQQRLRVFGERRWLGRIGELEASWPEPFERVPICWSRAFGGHADGEYGPIPSANNPEGRGYYLTKEQATGALLPNIEDPAAPLCGWNQCPDPVGFGFYPSNWGLRLARICRLTDAGAVRLDAGAGLFDRAHPRLSGTSLPVGTVIKLLGMGGSKDNCSRPCCFVVPDCPLELDVRLGASVHVCTPKLEEVLIDLHGGYVDLSYRKLFDYRFTPHEMRLTTLRMSRRH